LPKFLLDKGRFITVIRIFPNEESLERLIGALLKEINDDWISRKYINMDL